MIAAYEGTSLPNWRDVVSTIVPLQDLTRTNRRIRIGGFGDLAEILGRYSPLPTPLTVAILFPESVQKRQVAPPAAANQTDRRAGIAQMEMARQFPHCFQEQPNGKNATRALTSSMTGKIDSDRMKASLTKGGSNGPHLTHVRRREGQKQQDGCVWAMSLVLGNVDRSAPAAGGQDRQQPVG